MNPLIGRYREQTAPLAEGNAGVYQTLDRMKALIRGGANPWRGRSASEETLSDLFYWVRGHFHYQEHPPGEQTVISPAALLDMIERSPDHRVVGDCVSYTVLLGFFLHRLGVPLNLVVRSKRADLIFDHVYLRAYVGGEWIAADASGIVALGWEDDSHDITAREDVPVV